MQRLSRASRLWPQCASVGEFGSGGSGGGGGGGGGPCRAHHDPRVQRGRLVRAGGVSLPHHQALAVAVDVLCDEPRKLGGVQQYWRRAAGVRRGQVVLSSVWRDPWHHVHRTGGQDGGCPRVGRRSLRKECVHPAEREARKMGRGRRKSKSKQKNANGSMRAGVCPPASTALAAVSTRTSADTPRSRSPRLQRPRHSL